VTATLHKITANGELHGGSQRHGRRALPGLAKRPFVAGPHLNIYNLPTLQWMAPGRQRWVMPLEMGRTTWP
jgi:hypothetical protein